MTTTTDEHLIAAIGILHHAGQSDNARARAERRIAKALAAEAALPDLLAVCRKAAELRKRWQDDDEYGTVDYVDALGDLHPEIVAAIAKAEGGAEEQPGAGVIPCDQDGNGFAPADPYR